MLKKTIIILFLPFIISGCQESTKKSKPVKEPVKVIVVGDQSFPKELAGKWVADKSGWEFNIEPNGVISKALIDNGMVWIKPADRITTIPMQMGGKGTYKLGQWTVQYTPKTHELAVDVVVSYYHLDMGSNALEGNLDDWFVGTVSDDFQTWKADWIRIPKYIALTPKPNELPVRPEDYPQGELIFKKMK